MPQSPVSAPSASPASTTGELLAPDTHMDALTLFVGDLALQRDYYRDALGLTVLGETDGRAVLGRGATPLLVLIAEPGLPIPTRREAGLFHTAFLFETPRALAATVLRAARHPRSQFVGSSDHLVSEAFYFTDPEGNGIELYTDRPREGWLDDAGRIRMSTLFLDPNAYLRTHLDPEAAETAGALERDDAAVGHVHLQVGDIPTARAFYVDALGFETTVDYPGALFVSAGGYHHHLAMNVWNSAGAGPRAATLGLGRVAIAVPERGELDALVDRLRGRGIAFDDAGDAVTVRDPWGSVVRVGVGAVDAAAELEAAA